MRDGTVRLSIDRRHLSHLDFPLALEADGNRWVYGLAALTALAFWRGGAWAGLAAGALGTAIYLTLGLRDVARRLERRVRTRGLASVELWRRLWRFGGVVLTRPDGTTCRGPAESWMQLVRDLTPDSRP